MQRQRNKLRIFVIENTVCTKCGYYEKRKD